MRLPWNGVWERIGPQFHLLENADVLAAQPMLCLEQQWHYYQQCVSLFDDTLLRHALIDPKALATLRALDTTRLEWLGNVPIDALVTLRQENANEGFRKRLEGFTANLSDVAIDELNRVTSEVGRGIASLLADHANEARTISEKYQRAHKESAIAGWLTWGASFIPTLAPFMTIGGPAVLAFKYGREKANQLAETAKLSRSMMGVLATAKSSSE